MGCAYLNKQKQSHGLSEVMGVMKWYMQMPRELETVEAVGVSASLQSLRTLTGAVAHRASGWVLRLRSRRSAKWGIENNTAWYDQEKKLWVSIAVCLVFLRPSIYHTSQKLWLQEKDNILIKKSCGYSFISHYGYIILMGITKKM